MLSKVISIAHLKIFCVLFFILQLDPLSAQTVHERATIFDEEVLVPNAFSPNNDGVNDEFKIFLRSDVLIESFVIVNRYGEIVFQTSDANAEWDGKYKNINQPEGSYIYLVAYRIAGDGGVKSKKGSLSLIR